MSYLEELSLELNQKIVFSPQILTGDKIKHVEKRFPITV